MTDREDNRGLPTGRVTLYVTAVRYLCPACGLVWGTVLAFGLSLVGACLVYQFVLSRMA